MVKGSGPIQMNLDFTPGGGIGRRASLRGWCPKGREGSSPSLEIFPNVAELVDAAVSGTALRK